MELTLRSSFACSDTLGLLHAACTASYAGSGCRHHLCTWPLGTGVKVAKRRGEGGREHSMIWTSVLAASCSLKRASSASRSSSPPCEIYKVFRKSTRIVIRLACMWWGLCTATWAHLSLLLDAALLLVCIALCMLCCPHSPRARDMVLLLPLVSAASHTTGSGCQWLSQATGDVSALRQCKCCPAVARCGTAAVVPETR